MRAGNVQTKKLTVAKRTSIGRNNRPKNKHARKGYKPYRGQGRP